MNLSFWKEYENPIPLETAFNLQLSWSIRNGRNVLFIVLFDTMPSSKAHANDTAAPLGPTTFASGREIPEPEPALNAWLAQTRVTPLAGTLFRCTPDWHQKPRRLREALWYFTVSGDIRCRFGENTPAAALPPGAVLLVPRGIPHEAWSAGSGAVECITVHFQAELHGSIDVVGALELGGIILPEENFLGMLGETSHCCAYESTCRPAGWRRSMEAAIWRILLHRVRTHDVRDRGAASLPIADVAQLQPVFDCIEGRFHDPALGVEDLARAASVSAVTLRKRFRSAVGLSPVQFLRLKRIDRACERLHRSGEEIKTIAATCGFRDLPYFYRAFRAVTGTTPGAYRELCRM